MQIQPWCQGRREGPWRQHSMGALSTKLQNIKICFVFSQTGLCSSDRRQCSGSPLWDMEATLLIIKGGPDSWVMRSPPPPIIKSWISEVKFPAHISPTYDEALRLMALTSSLFHLMYQKCSFSSAFDTFKALNFTNITHALVHKSPFPFPLYIIIWTGHYRNFVTWLHHSTPCHQSDHCALLQPCTAPYFFFQVPMHRQCYMARICAKAVKL